MKESFLKLLISGNFSEADELVKDMNISELGTFLIDIICSPMKSCRKSADARWSSPAAAT